jgi:GNAT superfamily N-acetyltransferase
LWVSLNIMVSQAQDNEHEKDETLSLSSGIDVPFRLIQPDDVSALQRFHGRLSERTIYLRFFGSLEEFPEEKAQYFAYVDGVDHFALAALDPDDPNEIVAVVRYDRDDLVEDRWQDHGLGINLTRRLIDEARNNGVRFFYALVMGENRRMLELLRRLDLPEQERREDGVKHVEVELPSEKS